MSTYTLEREWIASLRGLAVGVSIASIFLTPAQTYPNNLAAVPSEQPSPQIKGGIVTTIPDGAFDLRTVCISTPYGLEAPILQRSVLPLSKRADSESIPHVLRDITGLPIETL
ncbi:MAG: hypothetical protein ACJ788_05420, partial [Ktedonobacteraceae bacterium]